MYVMGDEELAAVKRVMDSGNLFRYKDGEKTETDRLEDEIAAKMGVPHAIAMSSGTAALICGLAGMGIGPGHEVLVPAYTFISTALAPLAVGAIPVLTEIDESLTIDPADIEKKITPNTKAIIPVDMVGLPCRMDKIMSIAKHHNLFVLEDACQADGGSYEGKRLGTIGHAGTFSFNHFKILSAGESGALVTKDRTIYERARIHHDGGCVFFSEEARRQVVPFFAGLNFRISEILSAIVRVQLRRLDTILEGLREDKWAIMKAFAGVQGVYPNPINDPKGECGVVAAVLFDTPEMMRTFLTRCQERGINASTPIDSGRHVYTNWEPLLQRRGAHVESRNPLAGLPTIDKPEELCPKTLNILSRTAYISPIPQRDPSERESFVAKVREAADGCA
ncbi:MAG: aminotransferase [Chitinivibrionales bacterium]|nr:aminotransferase [Chitinivibrionales bacterium]